MTNDIRPIDANALALKISEYMVGFPKRSERMFTCMHILTMLEDENQTPTLAGIAPDCNGEPLTLEQLREKIDEPVYLYIYDTALIDREKWEPCEFCGEWMAGDCRPKEQDAGYKLYAGYCKQVAADDFFEDETEELNYCPICGRPLTPEAWEELERRMNA